MGKANLGGTSSTKAKGSTTSASSAAASTNTTSTETERGRDNDTAQGNPIAVVVELPGSEQAAAEGEKKPRKQRPKGLTYNKGNKPKVAQANSQDTVLIMTTLISGSFGIAAARLGKQWELSPEETNAIAAPATNILTRMIDSDKLEKYSDGAALLIALSMAIAPRAIMTAAAKKPKPANVTPIKPLEGVKDNAGGKSGEVKTSSAPNVRKDAAADTQSDVKAFLGSVSFPSY